LYKHPTFNREKIFLYSYLMNLFILSTVISGLLALTTFGAAWILNTRSNRNREKASPFECGFDPKNSARLPFSMRFFLLAIIFIVFDIEIVLLMPLPLLLMLLPTIASLGVRIIFLLVLTAGLLHEWHEGSLNWTQ
jgi:NADH-ubiquinone oxidoreductase chain 3